MNDIPIVMLHSVNSKHSANPMGSLSVFPRELDGYLAAYKLLNYQVISLSDLLEGKNNECEKFIIFTFDDGYKDNLYIVKKILMKYKARATIFVNPGYAGGNNRKDHTWGFMNRNELIEAEESGVFDVQAHALTHEFIFTSDKVIDFYKKEKFKKYYWLAWILFPESPLSWGDDANKYADKIPEGYPIFEYGRRLSGQKFNMDRMFIDKAIRMYKTIECDAEFVGMLNSDASSKGSLETYEQYIETVRYQLSECKSKLETLLDKEVNVICFPGGGYNQHVLNIAEELGYKCYINASKYKVSNNFDNLSKVNQGRFIGLNRFSMSHFENRLLSSRMSAMMIALISLGDYQDMKIFNLMKKLLKRIKNYQR